MTGGDLPTMAADIFVGDPPDWDPGADRGGFDEPTLHWVNGRSHYTGGQPATCPRCYWWARITTPPAGTAKATVIAPPTGPMITIISDPLMAEADKAALIAKWDAISAENEARELRDWPYGRYYCKQAETTHDCPFGHDWNTFPGHPIHTARTYPGDPAPGICFGNDCWEIHPGRPTYGSGPDIGTPPPLKESVVD